MAIGNNINEAIENLLSKASNIDTSNNENLEDLVRLIVKANENMQNSSKNGDWKLFGEDMQELTRLIEALKKLVKNMDKDAETQDNKDTIENIIQSNNILL